MTMRSQPFYYVLLVVLPLVGALILNVFVMLDVFWKFFNVSIIYDDTASLVASLISYFLAMFCAYSLVYALHAKPKRNRILGSKLIFLLIINLLIALLGFYSQLFNILMLISPLVVDKMVIPRQSYLSS